MLPRRRDALLALAALPFGATLAGCATERRTTGAVRVGMVTDVGGLGDRSFNDSAYRGLLRAKDDLHVQTAVLQSRAAADYALYLTVLANKEFDEIFAIGFLMAEDVAQVAQRYPQRAFAIVDAVVPGRNVTSAFLGGIDIPLLRKFEVGFAAGAREVDPAVDVLVKYVGSFDDLASAKELAGVLYGANADVIYVAAGKAGLGAIEQAKERSGVYVIGVDSDQDALAPGKVLTSVVKGVDVGVFRVCRDAAAHRPRPAHLVLGLREGGVLLTDFRYTRSIVTPPVRRTLDALRRKIVAGNLAVPSTREGLRSFRRVPL